MVLRLFPRPRRVWAAMSATTLALVLQSFVLTAHPAAALSPPGLTVTASSSTSVGLQIFANANLMGTTNPTGTITFNAFSPDDTSCSSSILTSAVPAGTSVNSARYTTTRSGTYRWIAAYSGDATYFPATSTCGQTSSTVVVSKAGTTINIAAPAPVGNTIHGRATLGGGYSPTGTITFSLAPPGDTFCASPVFTATVAVNGVGAYDSPPFTATVAGSYKWRASYNGDANSLANGPTPCLDPNAAVTVTTVTPPAPRPHWGHYQWGTESNAVRAFWLLDRTGDPAMHAAFATWAAYWNDGRARIDPALPYVAVATDDAYIGQCVHTGNAAYSLALACAGGASTPTGGLAELRFAAPPAEPHIISPFVTLRTGLDANALATSVCHQMGTIIGLPDNPDSGSCMSTSPRAGASLWYTATDGDAARSIYDGHAD